MTTEFGEVEVKLELGHRATLKIKPTPEGHTHDWSVFVRGPEGCNIQHFIDKVVFFLHPSFPKPKRVIKEPPYKVTECGYAGFHISIEIYFKNKSEPKKLTFQYDLFLRVDEPVNHIRCEKLTFQNPTDDFRRRLLLSGGQCKNSGTPSDSKHEGVTTKTASPPPSQQPAPQQAVLKRPLTPESSAFQALFGPPDIIPTKPKDEKKIKAHKTEKLPDKISSSSSLKSPVEPSNSGTKTTPSPVSGSSSSSSKKHEKSSKSEQATKLLVSQEGGGGGGGDKSNTFHRSSSSSGSSKHKRDKSSSSSRHGSSSHSSSSQKHHDRESSSSSKKEKERSNKQTSLSSSNNSSKTISGSSASGDKPLGPSVINNDKSNHPHHHHSSKQESRSSHDKHSSDKSHNTSSSHEHRHSSSGSKEKSSEHTTTSTHSSGIVSSGDNKGGSKSSSDKLNTSSSSLSKTSSGLKRSNEDLILSQKEESSSSSWKKKKKKDKNKENDKDRDEKSKEKEKSSSGDKPVEEKESQKPPKISKEKDKHSKEKDAISNALFCDDPPPKSEDHEKDKSFIKEEEKPYQQPSNEKKSDKTEKKSEKKSSSKKDYDKHKKVVETSSDYKEYNKEKFDKHQHHSSKEKKSSKVKKDVIVKEKIEANTNVTEETKKRDKPFNSSSKSSSSKPESSINGFKKEHSGNHVTTVKNDKKRKKQEDEDELVSMDSESDAMSSKSDVAASMVSKKRKKEKRSQKSRSPSSDFTTTKHKVKKSKSDKKQWSSIYSSDSDDDDNNSYVSDMDKLSKDSDSDYDGPPQLQKIIKDPLQEEHEQRSIKDHQEHKSLKKNQQKHISTKSPKKKQQKKMDDVFGTAFSDSDSEDGDTTLTAHTKKNHNRSGLISEDSDDDKYEPMDLDDVNDVHLSEEEESKRGNHEMDMSVIDAVMSSNNSKKADMKKSPLPLSGSNAKKKSTAPIKFNEDLFSTGELSDDDPFGDGENKKTVNDLFSDIHAIERGVESESADDNEILSPLEQHGGNLFQSSRSIHNTPMSGGGSGNIKAKLHEETASSEKRKSQKANVPISKSGKDEKNVYRTPPKSSTDLTGSKSSPFKLEDHKKIKSMEKKLLNSDRDSTLAAEVSANAKASPFKVSTKSSRFEHQNTSCDENKSGLAGFTKEIDTEKGENKEKDAKPRLESHNKRGHGTIIPNKSPRAHTEATKQELSSGGSSSEENSVSDSDSDNSGDESDEGNDLNTVNDNNSNLLKNRNDNDGFGLLSRVDRDTNKTVGDKDDVKPLFRGKDLSESSNTSAAAAIGLAVDIDTNNTLENQQPPQEIKHKSNTIPNSEGDFAFIPPTSKQLQCQDKNLPPHGKSNTTNYYDNQNGNTYTYQKDSTRFMDDKVGNGAIIKDGKSASTLAEAPNGERLVVLLELQKKLYMLASQSNKEHIAEIMGIIMEANCYEIKEKENTFDFDLCQLDQGTLNKIRGFLQTV